MRKDSRVDLLTGNMYKTIVKLGYPMALSALIHMLYNLADAFWLGKLGRTALAAPVISFNIIFFILSLGLGFSVAGTALVSQYMGANDREKASRAAGNMLTYMMIFSVFFVAIAFPFAKQFLTLLKTPADAFGQTLDYYRIMVSGIPLAFPFFVYQSSMNGYGDTKSPLKIQIFSASLNVILDPLLIFGWLDFPAMGVKGAAWATIFARGLASCWGLYHFFSGRKGLRLRLQHLKPDRPLARLMFKIGIPSAVGMSGTSLGLMVLIGIVNMFGTAVVSAYGIANRVIHLFMMPAMGISAAVTAIVGQNLGAGKIERAKSSVIKGLQMAGVLIIPAVLLVAFSGKAITYIFIPGDTQVQQLGHTMFFILSLSVLFFAFSSIIVAAFQGSGHTIPVMVTNLSRVWIFRIPIVYILSIYILGGPENIDASVGIWWGMTASNFCSFLMIFLWYLKGGWIVARIKRKPTQE